MILTLVSVNNLDVNMDDVLMKLNDFADNGWDIRILTNTPELFKDYNTTYYPYKVFSYYYKLLFPLHISEQENSDVFYVDMTNLDEISDNLIRNFNGSPNFLFFGHWNKLEYKSNVPNESDLWVPWKRVVDHSTPLTEFLLDYFDTIGFDYSDMVTIWEGIMYFPKVDNIGEIIYELEMMKPIIEYMSIMYDENSYSKKGIGNGEGLAMSYILSKFEIQMEIFDEKKHIKII